MSIFVLSFVLFISVVVSQDQLTRFTKAKEEFLPSAETSIILAWPLTAKASNQSIIAINVFIRNHNNAPLPNKKVTLQSNLGQVKEAEVITDKAGKATFNLSSDSPGIAEVVATADGVQVKQKVSIKFE